MSFLLNENKSLPNIDKSSVGHPSLLAYDLLKNEFYPNRDNSCVGYPTLWVF